MRAFARRLLVAAALLLAVAAPALAADAPLKGVALVIGQSAYRGLPVLANPHNDAEAMGKLLSELGFAVTTSYDNDQAALTETLAAFEASAKDAGVALVYYSGHGIEAGGENYLVPTDADLSTPQRAGATLVPVTAMLDALAKTVPVTIVLLDACRSDAFPAGTMIQPPGVDAPLAAESTGLGELRGPTPIAKPGVPADSLGMVIGFAASPGQPALDGAPGEPNSPYAAALLKHLSAGGYSFGDVMTMVSEEVYLNTKARQLPWVNSSLRRILSFGTPVEVAEGDKAAIRSGHRALLLQVAATPPELRATVETVAAANDASLTQAYALLGAAGAEAADPALIEKQIANGLKQAKRLLTRVSSADIEDAELKSIVELANEAANEGALKESVILWDRAAARAATLTGDLTGADDAQRTLFSDIFAASADAAALSLDYRKAADRYGQAGALLTELEPEVANNLKLQQATQLEFLGEFGGDTQVLLNSLQLYDEVMTFLDAEGSDDDWATAYNEFGYALMIYGERQADDEYLGDAEHAFQQVAGIWTKLTKPVDWARVQNNLGNVYASMGDRSDDPQRWQQAETAYSDALSVWTEADNPLDWAQAQNNMSTVLRSLGNFGEDPKLLRQAAEAYRAALRQWTPQAVPYDFALAQNNLGNALTDLAKYADADKNYADGLAAYAAALKIWSQQRQPLQWAAVQNNIGAAYATMGRDEEGIDSLGAAVQAYTLCLTARTKDNDPRNWALTQFNLGLVLTDIGDRTKEPTDWKSAVAAFEAALEVYDPDNSPEDWADSQEYLGWAEANLGALTGDRTLVEKGRAAVETAYDYYKDRNGAEEYYQDKFAAIDKLLASVS